MQMDGTRGECPIQNGLSQPHGRMRAFLSQRQVELSFQRILWRVFESTHGHNRLVVDGEKRHVTAGFSSRRRARMRPFRQEVHGWHSL